MRELWYRGKVQFYVRHMDIRYSKSNSTFNTASFSTDPVIWRPFTTSRSQYDQQYADSCTINCIHTLRIAKGNMTMYDLPCTLRISNKLKTNGCTIFSFIHSNMFRLGYHQGASFPFRLLRLFIFSSVCGVYAVVYVLGAGVWLHRYTTAYTPHTDEKINSLSSLKGKEAPWWWPSRNMLEWIKENIVHQLVFNLLEIWCFHETCEITFLKL
jgi:hypothetical protein